MKEHYEDLEINPITSLTMCGLKLHKQFITKKIHEVNCQRCLKACGEVE